MIGIFKRRLGPIFYRQALFVAIFFAVISPLGVNGAVLYTEPGSSMKRIGDFLVLEIKLDPGSECINAMKVELRFSPDVLRGKYFSNGGSLLSLWPESPRIDNERGSVTFIGGIPGGHCGSGSILLGSLIFEVKEVNEETAAEIRFSDDSQILLNDGLATPAKLEKGGSFLVAIPEMSLDPSDPWEKMKSDDGSSPEFVSVEIRNERMIFDGQHILLFHAVDDGSGMDHYLVSEQRRVGFLPVERARWERSESPYLLKDQKLRSIIRVKAIDAAGNVELTVIHPPVGWQDTVPWLILLMMIAGTITHRKLNRKKINNNERDVIL